MAQFEVTGKSFLITGGASGLGALYAEAFLKEGAKNVAIADIAEEAGKATTARLNATFPDKVTFYKCDVSLEEEIVATFDKVVAKFGQLDVIINNAGIMSDAPHVVRKACDVNWQGTVSFTMRGQKHMRKDEGGAGGTIINISSIAGISTFKALPAYAGSKAAVLLFDLSLSEATYYEETGVRVLTICLGATDTPLLAGLKDRAYNEEMGERLQKETDELTAVQPFQKPESAVKAIVTAYKQGAPGSIWLPIHDRPARDITPEIKSVYEQLFQLLE